MTAREQAALRRSIRKLVGRDKVYPSYRQLAETIGWDVSSLTRAAHGESGGSWQMFESIAEELRTTVNQLIGEQLSVDIAGPIVPLAERPGFKQLCQQAQKVADFDEHTWALVGQAYLPISEEAELTALDLIELAKIIAGHELSKKQH